MARRVRDREDAEACIRKIEHSGMTLVDWAHEHDIDARSLNMWLVNLERSQFSPKPQPDRGIGFVEWVPAVSSVQGGSMANTPYLVRCGGFEVEVPPDFDEATLSRLLSMVAVC